MNRRRILASWANNLYGRSYIEALGNESANFLNGHIITIDKDTRFIARVQRLDSSTTGGALFGFQDPFFRLIPFTEKGWRWQTGYNYVDLPSTIGSIENFECESGIIKNLDTGFTYGTKKSFSTYAGKQFVITRERPNTRVYFVEVYRGSVVEHKYGAVRIGDDIGFRDFVSGQFFSANSMKFTYGVT